MKKLFNKEVLYIVMIVALSLLLINMSIKPKPKINKNESVSNANSLILLSLLKNNMINQYNLEGVLDSSVLLSNVSNSSLKLSSLIKEKPKLIMRIYGKCSACIIEAIEQESAMLKKYGEIIGKENIIIIASFDNVKEFYTFQQVNNLNFNMYDIHSDKVLIPFEIGKRGIYYVFVDNYKTMNAFIPIANYPELTERYFMHIKNKFNDLK